ncbi:MAG: phytoene desaturase family protein [Puniceicoccaceae bacterium]
MVGSHRRVEGGHFDCIVIGAGMSGLAAGIRVAMAGKKVLVLEKHEATGGLNSYFFKERRYFDVGLHAMTNFVPAGTRGRPLTKILRQLRIRHEELNLSEQVGSKIVFPGGTLKLSNGIGTLKQSVAEIFPGEADRFSKLVELIEATDPFQLEDPHQSGREFLRARLSNPELVEMLLCPLFFYGSSRTDDIDLDQLLILFNALYIEGFARPLGGIRGLLQLLAKKLKQLGGERRMRAEVVALETSNGAVKEVHLATGERLTADWILSSVGRLETERLLGEARNENDSLAGKLAFCETLTVLNGEPAEMGIDATIVFFSTESPMRYRDPGALVDFSSGVVCSPNNYRYPDGERLEEGLFRVTSLASYRSWKELDETGYRKEKAAAYEAVIENALKIAFPGVSRRTFMEARVADDMFTPLTVERYTGHIGGAIYGSPEKVRDGLYRFSNLVLTGTDQGFLGITGAMLSGISMANRYVV